MGALSYLLLQYLSVCNIPTDHHLCSVKTSNVDAWYSLRPPVCCCDELPRRMFAIGSSRRRSNILSWWRTRELQYNVRACPGACGHLRVAFQADKATPKVNGSCSQYRLHQPLQRPSAFSEFCSNDLCQSRYFLQLRQSRK